MADLQPSSKSEDGSATPDGPGILKFPTPGVPLHEWTERDIYPGVMIGAIEAVMELARSRPDFEAQRLARKTTVRFRY
jgi:hypothetical protein